MSSSSSPTTRYAMPISDNTTITPEDEDLEGCCQDDHKKISEEPKKIDVELFKVKPCRSFALGKCIYGARCIYAHSQAEMRTRDVNAQLMRKIVSKDDHCKVDPNKRPGDQEAQGARGITAKLTPTGSRLRCVTNGHSSGSVRT